MCHARGSAESPEGRLSGTPNQNTSYNGILDFPIADQLKPLASRAGSLSGDDQRLLFMWLTSSSGDFFRSGGMPRIPSLSHCPENGSRGHVPQGDLADREFNGLVDTLGQPLNRPPSIEGLSFLTTNTVPTTEVVTTPPSTRASSIFVGDFSSMLIGIRSQLRITTLVERFADYGQVAFCCFLKTDVGLTHAAAFCRITGVN